MNQLPENILSSDDEEDLYEHHRIVVDKGQSLIRIDKFLIDRLAHTSRNKIQNAIDTHNIRVNNQIIKANYKVKPADIITVLLPTPPRNTELLPENIPINIIYEDEHLIILDKPAGMVVHPAHGNWTGTLVNALVYYLQNLPAPQHGEYRPGLVHRIDKDTSGLMVIAKTDLAMSHLARQFFDHTINRIYKALVWGVPKSPEGRIETLLARNPRDRKTVAVTEDEYIGKIAITNYKILQDYTYVSLIECKLETGRTHQIRAHMKHIGHPIFSDASYGGDQILRGGQLPKYKQFIENCFAIMPRQALHAYTLGFVHPATKKEMYFESILPPDFDALLQKIKNYS
ncbi:MAG: RluA family pseudouridine synthase [Cytophagales bacterium]|nr:RluA family pseudouridine synthase [Cytophagales bacterium]